MLTCRIPAEQQGIQGADKELGSAGRHLNNRLVCVLGHLMAMPAPAQPQAVTPAGIKGLVPPLACRVRCQDADPALQAMSAGQKMPMRTGPDHQKRL
jgi:hypothetical protein